MIKKTLLIGLVLLLFGSLLSVLPMVFHYMRAVSEPKAQSIDELLDLIKSEYHSEIDMPQLKERTIQFVLSSLDKHSRYLSPQENQDSRASIVGHFGGIGVNYIHHQDTIIVTQVAKGLYAEAAGIQSGDRIVQVDTTRASSYQLAPLIKGQINTPVHLRVKRMQVDSLLSFDILRGKVKLPSVEYYRDAKNKVLYISLRFFSGKSVSEIIEALHEMRDQDRLIIDLRDNGGGLLKSAIQISDLFLERGKTIVSVANANQGEYREYKAKYPAKFYPNSMHILVNRSTASASEIFASAMQDNGLAKVYGSQTFGKGLVQTEFQLDDGSLMRLTTATYKTPKGRFIQKPYRSEFLKTETKFDSIYGVKPDVDIATDRSLSVLNQVVQSRTEKVQTTILRIADKNAWEMNYDQFKSTKIKRSLQSILPKSAQIQAVYNYYRSMLAIYCLSHEDYIRFKYETDPQLHILKQHLTDKV